MELLDNINRLLGDDLKQTLKSGPRLKIDASCFSMYAFGALKDELERIEELARLLPLRAVFRDAGFRDSAMKINVEQIFRQLSPSTEVKCL